MPRRILVVEDEQHVARLVAFNLEQAGFDVEMVSDGRACLSKLDSWPPDLVVLDLVMPVVDGFAVMEVIRNHPDTRDLPVVALTARSEEADIVRGYRCGVDCYLTKPFGPDELVTVVRRFFPDDE